MIRVKICGITNLEDALAACEAGADALGFVFYSKSRRFIRPDKVSEMISLLPPFITTVGLFVDEDIEVVKETVDTTGIDIVQLHGDESPEYCSLIGRRVVKAFRVGKGSGNGGINKRLLEYSVSAYLLDAFKKGFKGGTGSVFDWKIARKAKECGRVILAGGLDPGNVGDAIREASPYGVDVSSGVEAEPGIKDHKKLREFIANVKECEEL